MNIKYFLDRVSYVFWWIGNKIKFLGFSIKWAYQRVVRDYDDPSIWDMHSEHSRRMEKMLRMLSDVKVGCPMEFYSESTEPNQCLAWTRVLNEMADGFKAANELDYIDVSDLDEGEKAAKRIELTEKFERGMDLFKKHYFSLWD